MDHMSFPEQHLKNTFIDSIYFSYNVSCLFSLMVLFWKVSRAEDISVPMARLEKVSGIVSAHASHTYTAVALAPCEAPLDYESALHIRHHAQYFFSCYFMSIKAFQSERIYSKVKLNHLLLLMKIFSGSYLWPSPGHRGELHLPNLNTNPLKFHVKQSIHITVYYIIII